MVVLVICKNKEEPFKNEGAKGGHKISPIKTIWELSVAMETTVLIQSGPKPNAAYPPPQLCSLIMIGQLVLEMYV